MRYRELVVAANDDKRRTGSRVGRKPVHLSTPAGPKARSSGRFETNRRRRLPVRQEIDQRIGAPYQQAIVWRKRPVQFLNHLKFPLQMLHVEMRRPRSSDTTRLDFASKPRDSYRCVINFLRHAPESRHTSAANIKSPRCAPDFVRDDFAPSAEYSIEQKAAMTYPQIIAKNGKDVSNA